MPTTRDRFITGYDQAAEYLGSLEGRALPGVETYLQRKGEDIAVVYRGTAVVTFKPDGAVVLNSGGWETATTKSRINQYIPDPWRVWQEDWTWYVGDPRSDEEQQVFFDGCVVRGGDYPPPPAPLCIECEEPIDLEHDTYHCTDDGLLCWACYEGVMEHASTLIHFSSEGKQVFKITGYFIVDEYGDDVGEWVDKVLKPRQYRRTDAWRGYYDTPPQDGYTVLTEGWSTGYPDEYHRRKLKLFDLDEFLKEHGEEAPGGGIYLLIEPTSNLFSQTTTILTANDDVEAVCEWLGENGFSVAVLSEALS